MDIKESKILSIKLIIKPLRNYTPYKSKKSISFVKNNYYQLYEGRYFILNTTECTYFVLLIDR